MVVIPNEAMVCRIQAEKEVRFLVYNCVLKKLTTAHSVVTGMLMFLEKTVEAK